MGRSIADLYIDQTVMDAVAEAKLMVPSISPETLKDILDEDNVLIIDVRDASILAVTGKVKGALNVSRSMLEFWADDSTPFYDRVFSKDKTIVLYCSSGGQSALAGKALIQLGYQDVRSLGAFQVWVEAGGQIEKP